MATLALATLALALAAAGACRSQSGSVLLVVVTLSGSLPPVASLEVMLSGAAGVAQNSYAHGAGAPIVFPTTLTAELPAQAAGDVTVEVRAVAAGGGVVALGSAGPISVRARGRQTVYVRLDCGGATCTVDGGGPPLGTDGGADGASSCGNGRIDPGETCDTAIAPGAPGACPPADCDDRIPCTTDVREGDACTAACRHDEIRAHAGGDGCCPAGASNADDPDCSVTCDDGTIDRGETCDTGIAAGAGGACPSADECDDADPCTRDLLISAGTCSAICLHVPVTAQSGAATDGCCPAGAWHAVDADCPIVCGNGILEDGESCEPGLPPSAGGCPTACDDGNPCTVDFRDGTGCHAACGHAAITALVTGDGCCPAGANRLVDGDCPSTCGNGVLEPGEACDSAATGAAACPTGCPAAPSACLREALSGSAATCTARCETTPVSACSASADGCCPAGCAAPGDPDCSATCGNGTVEAGRESCDTAIAPGAPGACPTSCSDGNPCTQDLLVSAGTCQAACLFLPITAFRAGDGCCPPASGNFVLDPDCAPVCGNRVAEAPSETCDSGIAGACPAACPPAGSCAVVRFQGMASTCNARCTTTVIAACVSADGCCPDGCTAATDDDCPPLCGDGLLGPDEGCDRGITAGHAGACPSSCDDGDACTADVASGTVEGCTRTCSHTPITACLDGDHCCPAGCTIDTDSDCKAMCGDRNVGAGETCDPPASCPTSCPDDGDHCTLERLTGDAAHCTAGCTHVPITACSGQTADLCCPTGCTRATDVDC